MLCIWRIFKKSVLTLKTLQDIFTEIQIEDLIILAITSNMEVVNYSERLMNIIS